MCEKVNKQLQVIKRFRNLIPSTIKIRLYKAFIQPISEKLELLNKQALRLILEDISSTYTDLLKKMNTVSFK